MASHTILNLKIIIISLRLDNVSFFSIWKISLVIIDQSSSTICCSRNWGIKAALTVSTMWWNLLCLPHRPCIATVVLSVTRVSRTQPVEQHFITSLLDLTHTHTHNLEHSRKRSSELRFSTFKISLLSLKRCWFTQWGMKEGTLVVVISTCLHLSFPILFPLWLILRQAAAALLQKSKCHLRVSWPPFRISVDYIYWFITTVPYCFLLLTDIDPLRETLKCMPTTWVLLCCKEQNLVQTLDTNTDPVLRDTFLPLL